jgi:hypothetical protein
MVSTARRRCLRRRPKGCRREVRLIPLPLLRSLGCGGIREKQHCQKSHRQFEDVHNIWPLYGIGG